MSQAHEIRDLNNASYGLFTHQWSATRLQEMVVSLFRIGDIRKFFNVIYNSQD